MNNKFHVQLDAFNLQAINFIKFDNYDESDFVLRGFCLF